MPKFHHITYHPTTQYSQGKGFTVESYLYSIGTIVGLIVLMYFYAKWTKNRFNFKRELLVLSAYIMQIDGDVSQKELHFVHRFLKKEFGIKEFNKLKSNLSNYLKIKQDITKALKKIDFVQNISTKIQLLQFLVRITIVDGYLKNAEYSALLKITKGLGLNSTQLDSVLAMHNYITENEHKKQRKRQTSLNSKSKLSIAFKILGLNDSATEKEIKKSYRKLVVLYHPDKLIHLDSVCQKNAKESYQKVNDAYELLKKELGFK